MTATNATVGDQLRWQVRSVIQHDETGYLPPWRVWEVRDPHGQVVERTVVWWYAVGRADKRADAWRATPVVTS